MIKKETLKKLAYIEANNLRNKITNSEKFKLDSKTIIARFKTNCIYGQITGNCDSVRSIELMNQCTATTVTGFGGDKVLYKEKILLARRKTILQMTPLEVYILNCGESEINKLVELIKAGKDVNTH